MNIRIGICDDDPQDIETLSNYIKRYDLICAPPHMEITTFLSGSDLLQAHRAEPFQILFLDIEMSSPNGMELARCLRSEAYDDVFIIFVTSYPKYMQESFEVQPFQFLVKPVSYEMIEKLLLDIETRYNRMYASRILLDSFEGKHLVRLNDLMYIQTVKEEKGCLTYHLTTNVITGNGTIQDWENRLSRHGFFSPFRGYLVNLMHVQRVHQNILYLNNGAKLPVSRRKNGQLEKLYANRIIHIMNE